MVNEVLAAAQAAGVEAEHLAISEDEILSGEADRRFGECVLWRNSALAGGALLAGAAYLEKRIVINTATYRRPSTSSKLYQQAMLAATPGLSQYALPTRFARSAEELRAVMGDADFDFPVVLKPDMGTNGVGIYLLQNMEDAGGIDWKNGLLVSPYLENDGDYRVFVLGGVAYGAMKRIGNDNPADFVAKSAGVQKLRAENVEIETKLREIAVQTALLLGLEYAGVDILRESGTDRYYVLDVNVSGGWQNGYRETTGVDVPRELVQWFVERDALRNGDLAQSLRRYLDRRLQLLSPHVQKRVEQILRGPTHSAADLPSWETHLAQAYARTPLLEKLAFVETARTKQYDSKLAQVILDECEASVSKVGNFLIDQKLAPHEQTLERGAITTAYYLKITGSS